MANFSPFVPTERVIARRRGWESLLAGEGAAQDDHNVCGERLW
jgi:hypothetical protein